MAAVHTSANINQDRRVVDMSDSIALLEPSETPLTVLLRRLRKRPAINQKFDILEDELAPVSTTFAGATETAPGTTITVAAGDGAHFVPRNVIYAPATGEQMLVTAVSGDNLTVVRGYGSTAAANLTNGDTLLIIGTAFPEGSGSATPNMKDAITRTNYVQIFKTSVEITRSLEASELYGGNDRAYQRRKKGVEHNRSIEFAFLFGEPKVDTSNAERPTYLTGGLRYWMGLSPNVADFSATGNLSEKDLEEFLEGPYRYRNRRKLLIAGPRLLSVINQFAASKLQVLQESNPQNATYGIQINRYQSVHGRLDIVSHPLLADAGMSGDGFVLDLEFLAYRPLRGRDTKLETNIHAPGDDLYKDQFLTEAGFELKLPKAHGWIRGVQTAV